MARITTPSASLAALVAAAAAAVAVLLTPGGATSARATSCDAPRAQARYERRVDHALLAKADVWGRRLLATPNGPSYDAASRYLAPLLYAQGTRGRMLTTTGVYYVPFTLPLSPYGARAFALHVADGSEVITRRASGSRLSVAVGRAGRELYGSCLRRLTPATLADGYLPVLETAYVDEAGVRYTQESFAGRVPGVASLVSFVHVTADARRSRTRCGPPAHALAAGPDGVRRPARRPRQGAARVRRRRAVRRRFRPLPDRSAEANRDLRGVGTQDDARPAAHGRSGDLRRGARGRRPVLAGGARPPRLRRPGAPGARRGARSARPAAEPHLALQHREHVRGAVVRGGAGRRPDLRALRLRRQREGDPPVLAAAAAGALHELARRRAVPRGRPLLPPVSRPRVPRGGGTAPEAGARRPRAAHRRPGRERPAGARALFVRHQPRGLRAARTGRRLAGAAGDGPRLGGERLPAARRPRSGDRRRARSRAAEGGPALAAAAARRLALRPRRAARRLGAVQRPERVARGLVLEPRRPVRAGVGPVPPAQPRGARALALHAAARLASARTGSRRRVHDLPRLAPGRLRDRPGLRPQRLALPGRQRRAGRARAQPLRDAGRGDDARHVHLRRGRDGDAAPRRVLPLDVPAAERRHERSVPREPPAPARSTRPAARTGRRTASGSRSRRRAAGCAATSASPSTRRRRASGRSRTRSSATAA